MDAQLEITGIIGGLLFLFGFVQVATNKWNGKSVWYEVCNFIGAVLLGYYSVKKGAYTNIALNIVWGTVALYALYHAIQRFKSRKRRKNKLI